jgi:hypothetical protein
VNVKVSRKVHKHQGSVNPTVSQPACKANAAASLSATPFAEPWVDTLHHCGSVQTSPSCVRTGRNNLRLWQAPLSHLVSQQHSCPFARAFTQRPQLASAGKASRHKSQHGAHPHPELQLVASWPALLEKEGYYELPHPQHRCRLLIKLTSPQVSVRSAVFASRFRYPADPGFHPSPKALTRRVKPVSPPSAVAAHRFRHAMRFTQRCVLRSPTCHRPSDQFQPREGQHVALEGPNVPGTGRVSFPQWKARRTGA